MRWKWRGECFHFAEDCAISFSFWEQLRNFPLLPGRENVENHSDEIFMQSMPDFAVVVFGEGPSLRSAARAFGYHACSRSRWEAGDEYVKCISYRELDMEGERQWEDVLLPPILLHRELVNRCATVKTIVKELAGVQASSCARLWRCTSENEVVGSISGCGRIVFWRASWLIWFLWLRHSTPTLHVAWGDIQYLNFRFFLIISEACTFSLHSGYGALQLEWLIYKDSTLFVIVWCSVCALLLRVYVFGLIRNNLLLVYSRTT